jgi:hypothetical protein
MVGNKAVGGAEDSVGGIIATIPFSRACCSTIGLRQSERIDCWSHAHPSSMITSIWAIRSKEFPKTSSHVELTSDVEQNKGHCQGQ